MSARVGTTREGSFPIRIRRGEAGERRRDKANEQKGASCLERSAKLTSTVEYIEFSGAEKQYAVWSTSTVNRPRLMIIS